MSITTWNDGAIAAVGAIASYEDDYPSITSTNPEETLNELRTVYENFLTDYQNSIKSLAEETRKEIVSQRWMTLGAFALELSRQLDPTENGLIPIDIYDTLVKKQSDYGHENISRFGVDGLLLRTHDKIARLENLLANPDTDPENESISDTLLDIIGYSAIGLMWENNTFLLELR